VLAELELFLQRFKLSHKLWDNSSLSNKYLGSECIRHRQQQTAPVCGHDKGKKDGLTRQSHAPANALSCCELQPTPERRRMDFAIQLIPVSYISILAWNLRSFGSSISSFMLFLKYYTN